MKKLYIFISTVLLIMPFYVFAEEISNIGAGFSNDSSFLENILDNIVNKSISSQVGIMILVFFLGFSITSSCIYHFLLKNDE